MSSDKILQSVLLLQHIQWRWPYTLCPSSSQYHATYYRFKGRPKSQSEAETFCNMWLASVACVSYHQNINSHTLRILLRYVFRLRSVCENLWYHGRPVYNRHTSIAVWTSTQKFITRWLFHGVDLTNTRPNLQVGLAPNVGCPLWIIYYTCSSPPYLEAICNFRSPKTLHDALAIWDVTEMVWTQKFRTNEAFWEFICLGQTL
jgi:hypothetical protein